MSNSKNFFRASAEDFTKIPGSPIAYWAGKAMFEDFSSFESAGQRFDVRNGITTSDNGLFLRLWYEVSNTQVNKRWFACNKGGVYRKWYGNRDYLIDWENDGQRMKSFFDANGNLRPTLRGIDMNFTQGITMSRVTSTTPSFRLMLADSISESATNAIYSKNKGSGEEEYFLALLNSPVGRHILELVNPTINVVPEDLRGVPVLYQRVTEVKTIVDQLICLSNTDWDAYETSWDFKVNPLVALARGNPVNPDPGTTAALYVALREEWAAECEETRRLEMENNRIFIEAYGLQDELTPDVPWNEITLTCNPWYRYGKTAPDGDCSEFPIDTELESRLKGDTVKELISYAVGCMMGRYSIDKPGLILADQGATLQDFLAKVPSSSYGVDEDGIIPILDNDWFADDIVTRFKEFVKVSFGEEHFFENMAWIEESLGKDIRSYFTKDFYKDHLQRYQNRPIYWLFQSPKGAFRALVYMHRYKPDMVGGVLGYLRSLQTKIDNQLDVAMQIGMDESKSASERVRANKDAVRFAKAKKELDEYERNVLYPLSTERIEIDLDDGVKVNYRKFGSALRKVAALEGKGE